MAIAIPFVGYNNVYKGAPGSVDISDLPVHVADNEVIACWKLDEEEIAHVVRTGEVWVSILGREVMPHRITGIPRMAASSAIDGNLLIYRTDGLHAVTDAMDYALLKHGDQPYGPYTHAYHLGGVVRILDSFGYGWEVLAAAWLHDVVEDTEPELEVEDRLAPIQKGFGDHVSSLVWAVTGVKYIDGVKQNRKSCNAQIYAKIDQFNAAAPLKVGDRIANMRASRDFNDEQKSSMYLKEYDEFFEKVAVHVPVPLQDALHEIRAELRAMFPSIRY